MIWDCTQQRKANVTKTIVKALHQYIKTKKFPTLKQMLENSAE
jgi:hypothetical protein